MPTPQELARTAEQYDEEQWFESSTSWTPCLAAASGGGRTRPAGRRRADAMAHWMARKHLVSDSGIREIGTSRRARPPTRSDFPR